MSAWETAATYATFFFSGMAIGINIANFIFLKRKP